MDIYEQFQKIRREELPGENVYEQDANCFIHGAHMALISLKDCVPRDLLLTTFRETLRNYFVTRGA